MRLRRALNEAHGRADALGAELEGEGSAREACSSSSTRRTPSSSLAIALKNAAATQEMEASAKAGSKRSFGAAHHLLESAQGEAASAKAALETEFQAAHDLIESPQTEAARAKAASKRSFGPRKT